MARILIGGRISLAVGFAAALFGLVIGTSIGLLAGFFRVWDGPLMRLTSWMPTARVVRSDVLGLKEREFVMAARSIGTRNRRIIVRHILPNVMSPVMVAAALGVAVAILTESALSFLGLGFPRDQRELHRRRRTRCPRSEVAEQVEGDLKWWARRAGMSWGR